MLRRNEGENPLSVDCLAAETERGSDSIQALPKRLDRYAKAHTRALAMTDYIRSVQHRTAYVDRVADQMEVCGAYLVFRHYHTEEKARLIAARTCKKHLLCPFCAIRRGAKMYARYIERIEIVLGENPHLTPWMVNFTVKNGEHLAERYNHLHKSMKLMNKYRHLDRGHEIIKAQGSVWSYEFKTGANSKLWHPHMHAIWLCSSPLDAKKLSEEWHEITGDSFIIDAHPMYGNALDACAEVFKYAVKFQDLPMDENLHAFEVLRSKRLVRSAGLLWGVQVPDTALDDELDDPYWIDVLYRFALSSGYNYAGTLNKSPAYEQAA